MPIVDRLATLLADHAVLMDHRTAGLLFPGAWDSTRPLSGGGLRNRATEAWRDTGLRPLGFHEGRHTFASLMIAAGVNAKALSTYMGHANISITLDRYGHLMPGNEDRGTQALGCISEIGHIETASGQAGAGLRPCLAKALRSPDEMSKLLSQKSAIKLLRSQGWTQGVGGKHNVKMTKPGERPITLPKHKGQDYSIGLTQAILRAAGIDRDEL